MKEARTYLSLAGDDDRALYMGNFLKNVASGMRTGWGLIPDEAADAFLKLRVMSYLCLPEFNQIALLHFLEGLDLEAWLSHFEDPYRNHKNAMVQGLKKETEPEGISFNTPKGGHLGKSALDKRHAWLCQVRRFAEKVGILPGDIFFIDPSSGRGTIRLSFAKTPPPVTEEGCRRLGRALRSYRKKFEPSR